MMVYWNEIEGQFTLKPEYVVGEFGHEFWIERKDGRIWFNLTSDMAEISAPVNAIYELVQELS